MNRSLVLSLLCFLFLLGLRLYHAQGIYQQQKAYFWEEGIPLLSELDSYYYLRLAEMVREGTYRPGGVDPLRGFPDRETKLPLLPPLLSCLLALTSLLSGPPPDRAFLAFPLIPFLASLSAFPLFFLGRKLKGDLAGLGMALGGGLSLEYLIRTDILRLDTDALNLFFLFLIAYLLLRLLERFDLKGLVFLALAVHLFDWWYGHPGLVIPLVVFTGIGYLLYGLKAREALKRTALIALFCNPWILYQGLWNLLGMFKGYVPGLLPEELGFIPRSVFAQSVSELQGLPFWTVLGMTSTHPLIGLFGLLGLGMLLKERRAVVLLPLFLLSLMAFFSGRRFIIYLGPFVGLGIGVLLQFCYGVLERRLKGALRGAVTIGLLAIVFLSIVSPYRFSYRVFPPINVSIAKGLKALERLTPEGASLWAWWDYGYPIAQITRRAVYHDGGSWGGPKSVLIARSFVVKDLEVAYNIVNGTTALGEKGLKGLLEEGLSPKEILLGIEKGRYNRQLPGPVYVVITGLDVPKFYWISFFGTWDPEEGKGVHLGVQPLGRCSVQADEVLCQRGILSLQRRTANLPGRALPLGGVKILRFSADDTLKEKKDMELGEGVLALILEKKGLTWGYLAPSGFADTAFFKLFFLGEGGEFFKPVLSDFPHIRAFEVRAR